MTITVKPGDDIRWLGHIEQDGVTDFTGYVLSSQVRARSPVTGDMTTLYATAAVAWLDAVAGLFEYRVDRDVTSKWPAGVELYLDVRVTSPDGTQVRTSTAAFKTQPGVTE